MDRLQGRLGKFDRKRAPEIELKFTFPDMWWCQSVHCCLLQTRSETIPVRTAATVMIRAREREFDRMVWPEFETLQNELGNYFEDVTDHMISRAMASGRSVAAR